MQNEFNNDANSQEQLNIDRDPLFTMSVELGEEKTDTIPIYEDSTPEKLAYEFCKKHNLDFQTLNYLSNQIRNFRLENQQQQEAQQQQIIIEEDEENQTSGQRGDTHSRSESNINKVNECIPTDSQMVYANHMYRCFRITSFTLVLSKRL